MLLRRPTSNRIYAELSLPGAMADGRVVYWLDRIILDLIPHEFSSAIEPDSGDGEIDIPVLKRQ